LYAVFARLGDAKHFLVIPCDDIAFLDAPSFDSAFDRAVPYAEEDLSAAARFGGL